MDLVDVFPENPFHPTVKYIAINQTPFSVPWGKNTVRLGKGFNSRQREQDEFFMKSSAFKDADNTPLQYRKCQITAIRDESGSSIAYASENASFAISGSVGKGFLSASVTGSLEKSVHNNRNASNISVRADHICGQIEMLRVPQLDTDAVRLLNTSSDPIIEFQKIYGDFYVAGYRVGAVNDTMISGKLANKTFFDAKRAVAEGKVAWAKVHKSINELSASASNEGLIRVDAFDSLMDFHSTFSVQTDDDIVRMGDVAAKNKQRAMTIAARATETLWKDFSLGYEDTVYQDVVDHLCDRGLVTELLLAPFATLREYQYLLARRRINMR
ncbi:hypothetical protein FOWG_03318 [Fusarium oxysporum f. sp. lycopersici MN25]|nr:hypothetical protein FOWG_03318 [Fusarium oxysporum f. sp. lycopersici MN25]